MNRCFECGVAISQGYEHQDQGDIYHLACLQKVELRRTPPDVGREVERGDEQFDTGMADVGHLRYLAKRVIELEGLLADNTSLRNLLQKQFIELREDKDKRIAELEAELDDRLENGLLARTLDAVGCHSYWVTANPELVDEVRDAGYTVHDG